MHINRSKRFWLDRTEAELTLDNNFDPFQTKVTDVWARVKELEGLSRRRSHRNGPWKQLGSFPTDEHDIKCEREDDGMSMHWKHGYTSLFRSIY